jgi:hypothetical protein
MIVQHCLQKSVPRLKLHRAFLLLVILMAPPTALAQRTDLIFLHNGDKVTGEIKELVRGQLRILTDAFGTIYVAWDDVERVDTDKRIQVEMPDGTRYFGPTVESQHPDSLSLNIAGNTVEVDKSDIIHLQPIKENRRFVGNLDNSLSIGLTYSKASEVTQWHVSASSLYKAEKYRAKLSFDSMITNNGTGQDSERRNLTARYARIRGQRWFWFGSAGYQKNDELGIDGRLIGTGGVGRYFAQSNRHEFLLMAGLSANREKSTGTQQAAGTQETNTEGYLRAEYSLFKLQTPKSSLDMSFEYFPSLTVSGRERGNLDVVYRQEFVRDLFWNMRFYQSFDTKPPAGAISKEDYGLVTSLEYLF